MKLSRRKFFKKSLIVTAGAAASVSAEERILLARTSNTAPRGRTPRGRIPGGKIGKVGISRLICGGNLINGYAHSRDLAYVSELMQRYFTDEKIIETLELCERQGINTLVANNNPGENTVRVLKKYRKLGGKIQWLAQVNPSARDLWGNIQGAIDAGAVGAFIQGGIGDDWSGSHPELIRQALEFIKQNGLIAGVAGHDLRVPMVCEREGLGADFYVKTLNTVGYLSGPAKETADFMAKVEKPWIAYKVLGAGVIHPSAGFKHAFASGADFICVGMFDFQVVDDVRIAKQVLGAKLPRRRPWRA